MNKAVRPVPNQANREITAVTAPVLAVRSFTSAAVAFLAPSPLATLASCLIGRTSAMRTVRRLFCSATVAVFNVHNPWEHWAAPPIAPLPALPVLDSPPFDPNSPPQVFHALADAFGRGRAPAAARASLYGCPGQFFAAGPEADGGPFLPPDNSRFPGTSHGGPFLVKFKSDEDTTSTDDGAHCDVAGPWRHCHGPEL